MKFLSSLLFKTIVSIGMALVIVLGATTLYNDNNIKSGVIENTQQLGQILSMVVSDVLHIIMKEDPEALDRYLGTIKGTEAVDDVRIVAAPSISKQIPEAKRANYRTTDELDQAVLASGQPKEVIAQGVGHRYLRRVLPITADADCLSCHQEVKKGDVVGALSFSLSLEKGDSQSSSLRGDLLIAGGICLVVIGIIIFLLIWRLVTARIQKLVNATKNIAEGDFSTPIEIKNQDEIGILAAAIRDMVGRLVDLIQQIQNATARIGAGVSESLAAARQQEASAAQQSATVNEITATMDELVQTSQQIAHNAEDVASIAERTQSSSEGGHQTVQSTMAGMQDILAKSKDVTGKITRLYERILEVNTILDIIGDIADKSDLLALNAELEGVRAGEAGKGFSLVAGEMRKLAENVTDSTKEIKGIVEEIQNAASSAVEAAEEGMNLTESSVQLATKTQEAFESIFGLVNQTTTASKQILLAIQQQNSGTGQVLTGMKEASEVISQNVTATKQATGAAMGLTQLAEELQQVVQTFKIERPGRTARR